jgi:hypothetical protein
MAMVKRFDVSSAQENVHRFSELPYMHCRSRNYVARKYFLDLVAGTRSTTAATVDTDSCSWSSFSKDSSIIAAATIDSVGLSELIDGSADGSQLGT